MSYQPNNKKEPPEPRLQEPRNPLERNLEPPSKGTPKALQKNPETPLKGTSNPPPKEPLERTSKLWKRPQSPPSKVRGSTPPDLRVLTMSRSMNCISERPLPAMTYCQGRQYIHVCIYIYTCIHMSTYDTCICICIYVYTPIYPSIYVSI